MRSLTIFAVITGILLALFLIVRPIIGELGTPLPPSVAGQPRHLIPDGVTGVTIAPTPLPPEADLPVKVSSPTDVKTLGILNEEEIEKFVLELVNIERAKAKLPEIQTEVTLTEIARNHSSDMIVRNYFDHDNPDGLSPGDRIAIQHRQLIGLTGENIWKGENLDLSDRMKVASDIMKDWMLSPGHRANILKPEFTHLGVGVSIKDREVLATQNFAMICGLTDQPIPLRVKTSDTLSLKITPKAIGEQPEKFDFFISDKGVQATTEQSVSDGNIKVTAGTYKLRFYFHKGNTYIIYWGPQIEVI